MLREVAQYKSDDSGKTLILSLLFFTFPFPGHSDDCLWIVASHKSKKLEMPNILIWETKFEKMLVSIEDD